MSHTLSGWTMTLRRCWNLAFSIPTVTPSLDRVLPQLVALLRARLRSGEGASAGVPSVSQQIPFRILSCNRLKLHIDHRL